MKYLCFLVAVIGTLSCQSNKRDNQVLTNGEVVILTDMFSIPELNTSRTIRIYLPPSYEESNDSYPVLYMHDGQNLFEDSTSFAGEWGVDEALNELSKSQNLNLIVVGIDNGGENRIHELTAWDHPRYGKAEGKAYMEFLVDVVKPYVDENYRTKSDRLNTAIMGSSLGGLISHYAIYEYSEVFSKAGIFSPSYWWGEGPFDQVREIGLPADTRLNFLVGGKEGEGMVSQMDEMVEMILAKGHPAEQVISKVNPKGEHNEKLWRSELKEVVIWLFK